jgi:hypothetical protein
MHNFPVEVPVADSGVSGFVSWKRYRLNEAWEDVPLVRSGGSLRAELPRQPPAGKLEYRLVLRDRRQTVLVPSRGAVVVRFKGEVPAAIIIVHVGLIFGAMLLSTRTAFEVFSKEPKYKGYTFLTVVLLFLGGLIFGPIVQKYAFDAYWTGWPFGHDLTDNKTAIAFLAWCTVLLSLKRSNHPGRWVVAAAVLTLVIFLIPHSLLGSELDYSKLENAP